MNNNSISKCILKHKFVTVVVLVSLYSVLTIVLALLYANRCMSTLECLYYSSQIVSALFVVVGVIYAGLQYYASRESNRTSLKVMQIQKAVDLSEYFKDNILRRYMAVRYVYGDSGISEILRKARSDEMKDFDMSEAINLYSEKDLLRLKFISNNGVSEKLYVNAIALYNTWKIRSDAVKAMRNAQAASCIHHGSTVSDS